MLIIGARVLATVSLVAASTIGISTATSDHHSTPTFHSNVVTAAAGVPIP